MARIGIKIKPKTKSNVYSLVKHQAKLKRDAILTYLAFIISLIALFKAFNVF